MKNNKGQVLVFFVLLLPILITCFALVVDTALLYIDKRKLDNVVFDTVNYGINHIDSVSKNKLEDMINKNIKRDCNINIEINNNLIKINISYIKHGVFESLFGIEHYEIKSSYKGIISDNKIKIVRE